MVYSHEKFMIHHKSPVATWPENEREHEILELSLAGSSTVALLSKYFHLSAKSLHSWLWEMVLMKRKKKISEKRHFCQKTSGLVRVPIL